MIRDVLVFTLVAFAMGGAGLRLAGRRVDRQVRRARFIKLATYIVIVEAFVAAAAAGRIALSALCVAVCFAGSREIARALRPNGASRRAAIGISYLLLSAGLVALAATRTPEHALFAYVIVGTFDGFAQVTGQIAGRRSLAPGVSPSKTIEGAAGGAMAALGAALWLSHPAGFSCAHGAIVCAALLPAALAGDLAASWIKRRAGVKDFGTLLPGHGGVLDRFDSLLGAAPIALLMLG